MSHTPDPPTVGGSASSADRPRLDTSVPHSARVWNYWLGGKDNYAADREMGEQLHTMMPGVIVSARADREFLHRVVTHLVSDAGVRQFLDLGTGLPTADNTHEVAQRLAPRAGSSTPTTTRWYWCTPRRCWWARPKALPTTSAPTSTTPAPSWTGPRGRWTSTGPSR
ncbi:hypothetical protein HNR25_004213 [Streptomonospora salina]|uniref:S-adenosyl methyltransferase n=1 Tax=Streptomonospora salina TaxID=104205 RepID=A0A841EBN1_9ACTN|nr:hypothetical protein [Streptomonospora salina]